MPLEEKELTLSCTQWLFLHRYFYFINSTVVSVCGRTVHITYTKEKVGKHKIYYNIYHIAKTYLKQINTILKVA